jgi:hypothetical protein
MNNSLTLLEYTPWICWAIIILVQIELWKVSKGILKFFRFAMVYFLIQSVYLFVLFINSNSVYYKNCYYMVTIIECLVMAGLSIELGSLLVLKFKKLIRLIGPFAIALPTFIAYEIISINEIGQEIFIIKSIRIAELAFISSLSLLFFCIAFENEESPIKFVARSYAVLLVMLIICTELQIRIGINSIFIRTVWPLSWLIGLSGMYLTLRRCRNKGDFKISYS